MCVSKIMGTAKKKIKLRLKKKLGIKIIFKKIKKNTEKNIDYLTHNYSIPRKKASLLFVL